MTDQPEIDIQFYQLVISLQSQAWQSLGKVASPMTGKIERNMEQAKFSIDMLEMFQRKTKGNLSDEEKKLLEHALYELRMNYLDESKKDNNDKQDEGGTHEEKERATAEGPDIEKELDKSEDKPDPKTSESD